MISGKRKERKKNKTILTSLLTSSHREVVKNKEKLADIAMKISGMQLLVPFWIKKIYIWMSSSYMYVCFVKGNDKKYSTKHNTVIKTNPTDPKTNTQSINSANINVWEMRFISAITLK